MTDNKAVKRRNINILQVCLTQLSVIWASYIIGYLWIEVLA